MHCTLTSRLWLTGWRGVVCDSNGRVWSLQIPGVRLAGTLPASISECLLWWHRHRRPSLLSSNLLACGCV